MCIRDSFGRAIPNDNNNGAAPVTLKTFFKVKDASLLEKIDFSSSLEKIKEKFAAKGAWKSYYTLQLMKNAALEAVLKAESNLDVKLELEENLEFFKNEHFKHSLTTLEKAFAYFFKKEFSREKYLVLLNHAMLFNNSFQRNTVEISGKLEEVRESIVKDHVNEFIKKKKSSDFEVLWRDIEEAYKREFTEAHMFCVPVSDKELQAHCKANKKNEKDYKRVECSELFRNACCCRECPFFLEVNGSFSQHIAAHKMLVPALHKTSLLHYKTKSAEEIAEMSLKLSCVDKKRPVRFNDEEEVMKRKDDVVRVVREVVHALKSYKDQDQRESLSIQRCIYCETIALREKYFLYNLQNVMMIVTYYQCKRYVV
eukprot:TRINITY_DN7530_c0_g1_i1.p2 TRINITY_DN7530_c0_g1~~TRINITY_DN7530_c0_g1_i1.p2  ORF type:complete len:369 (+),score=123.94 TRINITY_DN7530_c0_g1_i1:65-1171(+)